MGLASSRISAIVASEGVTLAQPAQYLLAPFQSRLYPLDPFGQLVAPHRPFGIGDVLLRMSATYDEASLRL
jgi:hypothetical protein